MYHDDRNPPHFHADYAENRALIDFQGGYVIGGALPGRQLKYVLARAEMHQDESMQNREPARWAQPLQKIARLM